MRLGAQAVASVYGIVYRGEFIYYQSGYDPAWRNKSVGLVLVGETFKDAIEQGLGGYDFLRGTESYKSDWVTEAKKTVAVRVIHGRGEAFDRREKLTRAVSGAARRLLPPSLVEQVRRLRRKRARI